jgi:DNA-binding MarR family transcriptional regulator
MHSPGDQPAAAAGSGEDSLAVEVAVGIERLFALLRWLTPPSSLSLTAAATLGTLLRSGPCRLTDLASREGVTQPAMTQLVARLQAGGLVRRVTDPSDGRVVLVSITPAGRDVVAGRRAARAERLAGLVSQLTPAQQQLLAAALPVIDILAGAPQDSPPPALPAQAGPAPPPARSRTTQPPAPAQPTARPAAPRPPAAPPATAQSAEPATAPNGSPS